MPLVLGLVLVVGAVLLLTSGVTDASFHDVITGQSGQLFRDSTPSFATAAPAAASAPSASDVNAATGAGGWSIHGAVNPVPGATGNRLDQGFDLTAPRFLSPFAGKVVASTPSSSGWKGGGYLAIANLFDPSQVIYLAEGLLPTVNVGDIVKAGQAIASPVTNPYNGAVGNIEIGPANPSAPTQPLAQVVSNPAVVVEDFYRWLKALGGPATTSASLAGHA